MKGEDKQSGVRLQFRWSMKDWIMKRHLTIRHILDIIWHVLNAVHHPNSSYTLSGYIHVYLEKKILVDRLQYFITMLIVLVVDNSFSNNTNKLTNASPFSLSFSLFYFLSGHCTSSLRVIRSRWGRLGQKRNDSRLSIKMMHLPVASAVRPSLQMAVGICVPTARPSSAPAVGEECRCAQIT